MAHHMLHCNIESISKFVTQKALSEHIEIYQRCSLSTLKSISVAIATKHYQTANTKALSENIEIYQNR